MHTMPKWGEARAPLTTKMLMGNPTISSSHACSNNIVSASNIHLSVLVTKSNLLPRSGSSLEAVEPYPKKF